MLFRLSAGSLVPVGWRPGVCTDSIKPAGVAQGAYDMQQVGAWCCGVFLGALILVQVLIWIVKRAPGNAPRHLAPRSSVWQDRPDPEPLCHLV